MNQSTDFENIYHQKDVRNRNTENGDFNGKLRKTKPKKIKVPAEKDLKLSLFQ